ncbi:hypothetical protein U1839_02155 [Sphingomonas sp. RT2P30]|uniref:hypothetical protein n=1 Tax=Parasphingomonas halimpatiens TaxID=3096162 RepID=UPI002FC5C0BB
MTFTVRQGAALAAGGATALAIALAATLAARGLWPAYAAAEPHKTYSVVMFVARLAIGALGTGVAAGVATRVAGDAGKAAWWLGGFFLALSLPLHLYVLWADYPAWYHLIYLSYLVPIAGLAGRIMARPAPPATRRAGSGTAGSARLPR